MARKARKPGLLFRALSVELEPVTSRLRTPCAVCGHMPGAIRVVFTEGAGRHAKRTVLCVKHGGEKMNRLAETVDAAADYIRTVLVAHKITATKYGEIPDLRFRLFDKAKK